jgi:TPR repeat protein
LEALAKGVAYGQFYLGLICKNGVGVGADRKKAAELIGQVASQGHDQARAELKKMNVKPEFE